MRREEMTEEIARQMSETRARTLRIFDVARDEEVLRQSPGGGFRPIIWHLAHIGVFEAYWLLQRLRREPSPDERYERIFDPIKTPREDSKDLPTRREMEAYLSGVRERALRCLAEARFDGAGGDDSGDGPLLRDAYIFQLVLEHERQHQETLAYLLHMLAPEKKNRPARPASLCDADEPPTARAADFSTASAPLVDAGEMVRVAEGVCEMGSVWNSFAYDNEHPSHTVFVPAFSIDRLLTTNEEYARFIAEGGYRRREWWSAEGWEWREREGWEAPLYWRRDREGSRRWRVRTMFDEGEVEPSHPVTGISWYEAEAYARSVAKRLPSEAEWEKAASWDAARGRKRRYAWGDAEPTETRANFDIRCWGTTAVGSFPEGASASGCLDMTGNVWEWTADPFKGFPGFEPFPYPEYSETWFDGDHRVLKGGSWATSAPVLRTSFRNFFRRPFRIGFTGIRCASDA